MNITSTNRQDWDSLRTAFSSSIMVDTALSSLAQSLDGPEWAFEGDTPADYIDLGYDEVRVALVRRGVDAAQIDTLAEILRETLAFDQPFGDMVRQVESAGSAGDVLLRNLSKVGIPVDFPMELAAVSKDTRDFCSLENLDTIGAFAIFCQGMAQNVIVGGDFKALLNALAHVDVDTLCRFLPLRKSDKSLHLAEALALAARSVPPQIQAALALKAGLKIPANEAGGATANQIELAQAELRLHASRLAGGWFKAEFAQMKAARASGVTLESLLAPLSDQRMEAIIGSILSPLLRSRASGTTEGSRSFWSRLFGRSPCTI